MHSNAITANQNIVMRVTITANENIVMRVTITANQNTVMHVTINHSLSLYHIIHEIQ